MTQTGPKKIDLTGEVHETKEKKEAIIAATQLETSIKNIETLIDALQSELNTYHMLIAPKLITKTLAELSTQVEKYLPLQMYITPNSQYSRQSMAAKIHVLIHRANQITFPDDTHEDFKKYINILKEELEKQKFNFPRTSAEETHINKINKLNVLVALFRDQLESIKPKKSLLGSLSFQKTDKNKVTENLINLTRDSILPFLQEINNEYKNIPLEFQQSIGPLVDNLSKAFFSFHKEIIQPDKSLGKYQENAEFFYSLIEKFKHEMGKLPLDYLSIAFTTRSADYKSSGFGF